MDASRGAPEDSMSRAGDTTASSLTGQQKRIPQFNLVGKGDNFYMCYDSNFEITARII